MKLRDDRFSLVRLKAVADVRPSGVDKHAVEGEVPVRLCNYVDVYKNDRITGALPFMEATATPAEIERFTLRAGDVLITKDSETPNDIAVAALVEPSAAGIVCGYHLALLRSHAERLSGHFLVWALKASDTLAQFTVRAQGITRFGLTTAAMGDVLVPVPPIPEQRAIAAFLDRECGKIDGLVAEQERLVALLKEKRQAVISEAVTMGLDPTAPTKPSGIPWLGDVPAHWGVGVLSRVAERVVVGIAEAAVHAYVDDGVPILRSTNVRPERIEGEVLRIDPAFARERGAKLIRANDLVTVRTGHAGVTALVPAELDGCQCFTMLITTIQSGHLPRFFNILLNSRRLQEYFSVEAWGSAQPNISVPILKAAPVVIPPRREQEAIARHVEAQVLDFDTLMTEAERAVALLRERRAALISAAVTGKIDVRGLAPAAEAA